MNPKNLGERLQDGLAVHRSRIEDYARILVKRGGSNLVAPMRERLAATLARLSLQIPGLGSCSVLTPLRFNIVVVGSFSTGKSTLLTSMAGDALLINGVDGGLLPESDSPCTAIPTYLSAGGGPLSVYLVESAQTNSPVVLRREISVQDLKAMHLHPVSDGTDPFPDVSRIEIEGVLPHEFENATLIDTLGSDDRPERTVRTIKVAQSADAIVVVLRGEDMGPIATSGELNMLRLIAPPRASGGKKVFFVINAFNSLKFSPDDIDYLWTMLLTEQGRGIEYSGQTLEQGDIFVVNAAAAKRARLEGDNFRLAASGIESFEARLADYLVSEGVLGKIQPVVGDLIEAGEELVAAVLAEIHRMRNRRIDAGLRIDAASQPLSEIIDSLDTLHQETKQTSTSILLQIRRSFEAAMMSSVNDVSAALNAHDTEALRGWFGKLRNLVSKSKATKEVEKVLKETVEAKISKWARNTTDATSPVRIFESEQRALIEVIARRLAETEVILGNARREIMGLEIEEGAEIIRSRMQHWRSLLETTLHEAIASHIKGVDFTGDYFSAAFGAILWGTLANMGLVPVTQAAIIKIGIAAGLKGAAVGIASTVAFPLTAVGAVLGALAMNSNADSRLKSKMLEDFTARMQQTTETVWKAFEENLSVTILGARDRFDLEISGVIEGARGDLACLLEEAHADVATLQAKIVERQSDADSLAAEVQALRSILIA